MRNRYMRFANRIWVWIEPYFRRLPYSFGQGPKTVWVRGHWRRIPLW